MPLPENYGPRVPDHKKHPNEVKSLYKSIDTFRKTKGDQFGGFGGALGPHLKASQKGGGDKRYHLGQHHYIEYFVMEILSQLHLIVPQSRLTSKMNRMGEFSYPSQIMATKSLEEYIPITALLDLSYFRSTPPPEDLRRINKRYHLDAKNQLIVDNLGNHYKISGNLFASNLGGILVQDSDFQASGLNLGVIKRGQRFFGALLDKDMCTFDGKSYQQIYTQLSHDIFHNEIFNETNQANNVVLTEQKLFILNAMAEAIQDGSFHKIFSYQRVVNTGVFAPKDLSLYAANIEKTALSIVGFFTGNDPKILAEFKEREQIRQALADKILAKMNLLCSEADKAAIKAVIMEDLRAPYYQHLFKPDRISKADLNNEKLIDAIMMDQLEELKGFKIYPVSFLLDDIKHLIQKELKRFKVLVSPSKNKEISTILSQINKLQNNPSTFKPHINLKEIVEMLKQVSNLSFLKGNSINQVKVWMAILLEVQQVTAKEMAENNIRATSDNNKNRTEIPMSQVVGTMWSKTTSQASQTEISEEKLKDALVFLRENPGNTGIAALDALGTSYLAVKVIPVEGDHQFCKIVAEDIYQLSDKMEAVEIIISREEAMELGNKGKQICMEF